MKDKSVPSENIIRLRELTERLSESDKNDYKYIVKKLKDIVEFGKNEIDNSKSPQSKIKCYETMCTTITNLLTNINLI